MKLEGLDIDWEDEFNGAITVCDEEGIIVCMNKYSIDQFKKYGGAKLIGTSLIDCHPEPSKTKLKRMLNDHSENMYITEKNSIKKIILQTPWNVNGKFRGIVEISFQLDSDLPGFSR